MPAHTTRPPFRTARKASGTNAGIGDQVGGVTAVTRVAGKQGAIAEIFAAIAAISALSAGPAKPRHADALPDAQVADPLAGHIDVADDFVTGHNGKLGILQFAVD